MIRKTIRAMLPEYVNQTLNPVKRWVVELWLKSDSVARVEVQALYYLRNAVQAQPVATPSTRAWNRIQHEIEASLLVSSPTHPGDVLWRMWAGGMVMVVLSLFLLWYVLPPGIILQWSAQGGQPEIFRIYRTVSGQTENFELIKEIPAENTITSLNARVYTYRDFLLMPGRAYTYRVEAIDQAGLSTSQTVNSHALSALPGQLALGFALIIVGYGLSRALQKPRWVALHLI